MRPAISAALFLLLAACRVEDGAPTIEILSPAEGEIVPRTGALVIVDVDELTLTRETFPPPLAGGTETGEPFHGHYHLYVGEPGADAYSSHVIGCFFEKDVRIPEMLPIGPKEIMAILANQNHVAITGSPAARVQVSIVP